MKNLHLLYSLLGTLFFSALCFVIIKDYFPWTIFHLLFSSQQSTNADQFLRSYRYETILILFSLYLAIALAVLSLLSLLKGGFQRLKTYQQEGALYAFVLSFTTSLFLFFPVSGLFIILTKSFDAGILIGAVFSFMLSTLIVIIGGPLEEFSERLEISSS